MTRSRRQLCSRLHRPSLVLSYIRTSSIKLRDDASSGPKRPTTKKANSARAYSIAGPTVWNSLHDELRDPALGFDSFGQFLKTRQSLDCLVLRNCSQRIMRIAGLQTAWQGMRYINLRSPSLLTSTYLMLLGSVTVTIRKS